MPRKPTPPDQQKVPVGIRLDPDTYARLKAMADADRRAVPFFVLEAIDAYLLALDEADRWPPKKK